MKSERKLHSAACPRLLITGLRGSSGKTMVALGLTGACRSRGLGVAPFKKGPDYIDPAWHARASGRPCRNLDPYLMTTEQIRRSLGEHGAGADICLIEGNHGLFDGVGAHARASTAELAKLLQTPVVLLVDCTKATRTVAALVLGCQHLDPAVPLAGVILNRVGNRRQEAVIRTAVTDLCRLPVLGSIPRLTELALPERHLGLLTPAEHPEADLPVAAAQRAVETHLDVEALLTLARGAPPLTWEGAGEDCGLAGDLSAVRVGVVRDAAFTFYYPENLEALERLGAELVPVNALEDSGPADLDALYIGGGYPETHAAALAANARFRLALRREIEAGLPVLAECGGLIYLGDTILREGASYPMARIFPVSFELGGAPRGHGYTSVRVEDPNPFFPRGTVLRGHEFRYSIVRIPDAKALRLAFRMERGFGFDGRRDGLVYKNVLASFCHFHALGTRRWAEGLVRQARLHRRRRRAAEVWTEPEGAPRGKAEPKRARSGGTRTQPA